MCRIETKICSFYLADHKQQLRLLFLPVLEFSDLSVTSFTYKPNVSFCLAALTLDLFYCKSALKQKQSKNTTTMPPNK